VLIGRVPARPCRVITAAERSHRWQSFDAATTHFSTVGLFLFFRGPLRSRALYASRPRTVGRCLIMSILSWAARAVRSAPTEL